MDQNVFFPIFFTTVTYTTVDSVDSVECRFHWREGSVVQQRPTFQYFLWYRRDTDFQLLSLLEGKYSLVQMFMILSKRQLYTESGTGGEVKDGTEPDF